MANIIVGYPNRVDAEAQYATVAFSGGSWEADLPLTNLRDPQLQRVARSTDATTANTQFDVDLGVDRDVKLVAIPDHNLSTSGQYRIRGATDSGFTDVLYDSGWQDAWPIIYPFGSLEFEHPSWWTGTETEEEIGDRKQVILEVLDTEVICQYWRVEFDDTSNADGYVEIPRLIIAPGYQPEINIAYGATIGHETDTLAQTSLGGTRFYDRRPTRRVASVLFDKQDLDDALVGPFDIQARQGIDKQVMVVLDADDTSNKDRLSFLATLRRLSALEFTNFDRAKIPMQLEEVL